MIIDCDACVMEGTAACVDCIVPVLLADSGGPTRIRDEEEAALRNLAEAGLVAPIRLVPRSAGRGVASR